MAGKEVWSFRLERIESHNMWLRRGWNRRLIHTSILTPTAIDRESQRWMQWVKPGSGAGEVTGFLDLDIRAFFDNLDQHRLMRAVKKHASQRWMVLYIERWLKAPVEEESGRL